MTYTPRFSDPRVQRRIKTAVESMERYLKPNQVYTVAQSQRTKWFGCLTNPVSAWLDTNLLEVVDSHFNYQTGLCKKYRLNVANLQQIKETVGISNIYKPTVEIQNEITTGDFEYQLKSDRWFTPAQFIPSEIRGKLLANAGYRYKYDIEAAAPTILVQRAQQIQPDFQAPALTDFITNRTAVRNQIAVEAQTTPEQVKTVLNALLQGSVLTTWTNNKLFCALNCDYNLVERLKQSQTLTALRSDIKRVWQCLRDEFPREYTTDKNGTKRCRKLSAREKSAYYRKFENEVARVIQRSLRKQKLRFLWVHDGWQCDSIVDPNVIQQQVRRQTGFAIKLDWEMYEN